MDWDVGVCMIVSNCVTVKQLFWYLYFCFFFFVVFWVLFSHNNKSSEKKKILFFLVVVCLFVSKPNTYRLRYGWNSIEKISKRRSIRRRRSRKKNMFFYVWSTDLLTDIHAYIHTHTHIPTTKNKKKRQFWYTKD